MGIILGIFIFLLLSAFFSGSEIAFVTANKLGMAMEKSGGSRRAKILSQFYQEPNKFISTMLVGNNIALVAFTYFMTIVLEKTFPGLIPFPLLALLVFTLITTIIVLVFGEFMPKTFFRLYSNNILLWLAYPLYFFKLLLAPPTWLMNSLASIFLKIFRVPQDQADYTISKVDVQDYFEEQISEIQQDIDKEFLTKALNLNEIHVREAMVPRTEIVSFDINDPKEEIIDLIRETKLSRIILVDEDIENVIGYIHHQQLLSNPQSLKKIAIDIPFVPEAMNLQDLLSKFIQAKKSIACVVDEYGSLGGIITLEDIIEEIFGDIEDEFDDEELLEQRISEKEYLFSGRIEIDHINEKYENINIPEGDYQTLSGYMVMTSGSIPEMEEEFITDSHLLQALQVSDNKVDIIRLVVTDENDSENNSKA